MHLALKQFKVKPVYLACLFSLGAGVTQPVVAADSIAEALEEGDTQFSFRARYETVDTDADENNDASATTLKTRATYTSGSFKGFSTLLEFDDVTELGPDNYNNGVNGLSGPAIVDPEGTEVNQAFLAYTNFDTTVKYGRQRILLDNQRFVGGVGWRQNEQTYDAVSITNNSLADTTLFLAHVYNVNRIFGEASDQGDHESSTDLFNAKYSGLGFGDLVAYYYDIDNQDVAALSSKTMGVRFAGEAKISDKLKMPFEAEYATQSDAHDNPTEYDADYIHLVGGINVAGYFAKLGYEVLGSDDGAVAFSTPLATLHKFQGWTDQFLATPGTGIDDLYLLLGGSVANVKLLLHYHIFKANEDAPGADPALESGDDYGDEIGFSADYKFANGIGVGLKAADFSSEVASKTDIQKIWVTTTYSF